MNNSIIIENKKFRLVISEDCKAESLILKSSGEELLADEKLPLFSVTQERPFNNEIKLIYMNKRTTYPANRVRQEGDKLIVGFELAPYEVQVGIKVADSYISFTLDDFIVHPTDYDYLKMQTPPVAEFRLMQLPVKDRARFGKWLNVMWDDGVAIDLLATEPHARIDSEKRNGFRILTADAVKGIKLRGCTASLIVSEKDSFLDVVDTFERDYGMPLGVASRRGEMINSSIYWSDGITPENVDEHIEYMKRGGFKLALIYYRSIFYSEYEYTHFGDFTYRPEYKNGIDSLREMLAKIKAAGITPGFHFLHTHIGINSHYMSPRADRRINTKGKFTLAKPLGKDDTVIYVDENPTDTVMHPDCRFLKFGTEIIKYESYTTEPPYRFLGCERGEFRNQRGKFISEIVSHPEGEIGGILDMSEFCGVSVYLNQNTDLQDEIADKIAEVYGAGFEFAYYDGSEGVQAPYEFHVPNAQYRVYKKLPRAPLFCEGAAKSHFTWHMLSGANAFDVFPTEIFKAMIDKFPVVAAQEMQNDFTRVNFGWWELYDDTRPDVYEYGMSRAIAWNCPATMIARAKTMLTCPLRDDVLAALFNWQEAKRDGFFTEEIKKSIREDGCEYTLFKNECGAWELQKTEELKTGAEGVYAFAFTRGDDTYVSLCYSGDDVKLEVSADDFEYLSDVCGEPVAFECCGTKSVLPVSHRRYIKTKLSVKEVARVLAEAKIV